MEGAVAFMVWPVGNPSRWPQHEPGSQPALLPWEVNSLLTGLLWLIPLPRGVLGNQASLVEARPHGTSCLLKINGVSPVPDLRGLPASFLPNQPPATTPHQSRGRQPAWELRKVAGER